MSTENRHTAPGQLTGYLYQVLSALLLLLDDDPDAKLAIEKFDDIAFVENDEPVRMIQTKHQIYRRGYLNDTSVDLWRTIRSWCDTINGSTNNMYGTKFVLITTALNPENSAASFLSSTGRDTSRALKLLVDVATAGKETTNQKAYKVFLEMGDSARDSLIKRVHVYDGALHITELKASILKFIRCSTYRQYEDKVYDKVVGWWIGAVIECLCSEAPVFIHRSQLQNITCDIGSEYKADSLPTDVDAYYNPSDQELEQLTPENRLFIEQLKLIAISSAGINRCIRDYYNAFQQRSRWVREQLLMVNELEAYEARLIDEWDRLFIVMNEKLDDYGQSLTDQTKQRLGRELFRRIEEKALPIRERVTQPFIMRGTYHGLANQLTVGWHVDYLERLCNLLKR